MSALKLANVQMCSTFAVKSFTCQKAETNSAVSAPRSATGVFQNLIELKYALGALAWYWVHEPAWILFMNGHAFVFAGVSPKPIACSAWTFGVETHFIHR